MPWYRIDHADGKEECIDEQRVLSKLQGTYLDVRLALETAQECGMALQTPYATYQYRED